MKKDNLRVAVLGSGPSGLLAAHAARLHGLSLDVLSVKSKSKTGGAMYLHSPIPYLSPKRPEGIVRYRMMGDAATYARKVYGTEDAESITSFNKFKDGEEHEAWNLITAYDLLWRAWEPSIIDVKLSPAIVDEIVRDYHIVLSTIPANITCYNRGIHEFPKQGVWVAPDNVSELKNEQIVYNGTDEGSWYRQSNLWGWRGTEWGVGVPKPPLQGVVSVNKPIRTNCDCYSNQEGFMRLGRYGKWDKNVLTHHSFQEAYNYLAEVTLAL